MSRTLTAVALASLFGLTVGAAAPGVSPQKTKPQKNGKPDPASAREPRPGAALLAEDKGKFRILLDGQPVGSEEFRISPDDGNAQQWTARGSTEIRLPGGASQVSGRLQLAPDGTPRRYEWTSQSQKKASATVEFQGNVAKMSLELEGAKPFVQDFTFGSPRVVILDNNLYHHYALLARLYDWNARGAQTFPVLIPQEMTPGMITVEALGPQQVDGAALELLRVRTADLEINLYFDASHRLVRLDVPASKAVIVRE